VSEALPVQPERAAEGHHRVTEGGRKRRGIVTKELDDFRPFIDLGNDLIALPVDVGGGRDAEHHCHFFLGLVEV